MSRRKKEERDPVDMLDELGYYPESKKRDRQMLMDELQKYLQNGGKIKVIDIKKPREDQIEISSSKKQPKRKTN